MRVMLAWWAVLFAPAWVWAADPPMPPPAEPDVILPVVVPTPVPVPPPLPNQPVPLGADEWYVVESRVELIPLASPDGVLKVSVEEGPVKYKGKFVGGGGKTETKTFKSKYVYTVEVAAGKSGVCDVAFVKSGAKSISDIVRVRIAANVGPQPPPDPGPGPGPKPPDPPKPPPDPQPDDTPTKLWVVIVEETADAAANRGLLFADKALSQRMLDKGHKWRAVDQNVVGTDGRPPADIARFLDAAKGKAIPQVFLVDEKGKTRWQANLPAKASDLLAAIVKCGG